MNPYVILTDSSCDLPASMAESMELEVLPLHVNIDGDIYANYLDEREITFKDFFARIKTAKSAKTSAVNSDAFCILIDKLCREGKDVLYLGFDSGISGTYNAGAVAMREMREKYPECKLIDVDTLCASMGQGLLITLCYRLKQQGKTIEEVAAYAEENKMSICHWFTVEDLFYLKRGGRVSAATAIVGSALSIKPVMHVDNEGKLQKCYTARGRKASIRALVNEIKERNIYGKDTEIFVAHGDCEDDVAYMCNLIRSELGMEKITISYIGPVIGSHTGPGIILVSFIGKER